MHFQFGGLADGAAAAAALRCDEDGLDDAESVGAKRARPAWAEAGERRAPVVRAVFGVSPAPSVPTESGTPPSRAPSPARARPVVWKEQMTPEGADFNECAKAAARREREQARLERARAKKTRAEATAEAGRIVADAHARARATKTRAEAAAAAERIIAEAHARAERIIADADQGRDTRRLAAAISGDKAAARARIALGNAAARRDIAEMQSQWDSAAETRRTLAQSWNAQRVISARALGEEEILAAESGALFLWDSGTVRTDMRERVEAMIASKPITPREHRRTGVRAVIVEQPLTPQSLSLVSLKTYCGTPATSDEAERARYHKNVLATIEAAFGMVDAIFEIDAAVGCALPCALVYSRAVVYLVVSEPAFITPCLRIPVFSGMPTLCASAAAYARTRLQIIYCMVARGVARGMEAAQASATRRIRSPNIVYLHSGAVMIIPFVAVGIYDMYGDIGRDPVKILHRVEEWIRRTWPHHGAPPSRWKDDDNGGKAEVVGDAGNEDTSEEDRVDSGGGGGEDNSEEDRVGSGAGGEDGDVDDCGAPSPDCIGFPLTALDDDDGAGDLYGVAALFPGAIRCPLPGTLDLFADDV